MAKSSSFLKFFLIFGLFLSFHLNSYGEIRIVSVAGASASEFGEEISNPTIFGGIAGLDTDCDQTDGVSPCDNCSGLANGTLQVCNSRRIYDNLKLVINFRDDSLSGTGDALLTDDQGTTKFQDSNNTKDVGSGQQATVQVSWSEVCQHIDNSNNCDGVSFTNGSKPFRIGMDTNDDGDLQSGESITITVRVHKPTTDTIDDCDTNPVDGICDFTAFPGDGKVFIKDVGFATGFPNTDGIEINKLRVFITEEDQGFPGNGVSSESQTVDIEVDGDDFFLENNKVEGLENGVTYFFRIASVDQAENVAFVTSDAAIDAKCNGNSGSSDPTIDFDCDFVATPDRVFGLLEDDFNCFVATASFGTPLAPEVLTFRYFRYKILLKSKIGKWLNRQYYTYGPIAADWIRNSQSRKQWARVALYPLLGFAKLSIALGLWPALLITLFLFIGMFLLLRLSFKRVGWIVQSH